MFISTTSFADFSNCRDEFYARIIPSSNDEFSTKDTYSLCFNGFAVLYSIQSKTPLWSAEYLTKDRIYKADEMPREDSFHEESRIPTNARSQTVDYLGSGYDRGHLAPNADMADLNQQYDSFSLANIVPQSPYLNRKTWKAIESATRYLTKIHGESYILTGIILSKESKKLDNGVRVPSYLYKVVYIPSSNQAGVYYAPNDESGRIEVISVDEFSKRTGIHPMPALDLKAVKAVADLPMPNQSLEFKASTTNDIGSFRHEQEKSLKTDKTTSRKKEEGSFWFSLHAFSTLTLDWATGVFNWIKQQLKQ